VGWREKKLLLEAFKDINAIHKQSPRMIVRFTALVAKPQFE